MFMNLDFTDQFILSVSDFGSMSEEEQIVYVMQMFLVNFGNFFGYYKKNLLICELLILKFIFLFFF